MVGGAPFRSGRTIFRPDTIRFAPRLLSLTYQDFRNGEAVFIGARFRRRKPLDSGMQSNQPKLR
jgi:hypothetical protein